MYLSYIWCEESKINLAKYDETAEKGEPESMEREGWGILTISDSVDFLNTFISTGACRSSFVDNMSVECGKLSLA